MDGRRRATVGLALWVLSVATSCSSDDGQESVATTGAADTVVPDDADGEMFSDSESSGSPSAIEPVITFETVPDSGVPGIDSDDEFCRSWSEYAGTFAALANAWSVRLPDDAAALEVSAASAIVASLAGMSADLPAEIEPNRQAFTVDVPGPFLRRAERSLQYLAEAGADDEAVVALGDAWIAAITEVGPAADDLSIVVPDEVATALAAAAERFAAELPSMLEDPTLDTTRYDISPSLDYISGNCPDQGTLAGNDNVGLDDV